MFIKNAPSLLLDLELVRRQLVLIVCRPFVVLFIVLTGWELDAGFASPALVTAAAVGLSVIYLIWLRHGRLLSVQIRTQLFLDVILVTWLISDTGILVSPYGTLYVIIICLAGLLLGRLEALAFAGLCAAAYVVLALLSPEPIVYSITGEVEPSSTTQRIAFTMVAYLLVGLLAAWIADRRNIGENLKRVEANFANLKTLHERILFSINSGLVTTDMTGKIFAFNRAAEEITGHRAAATLGKNVADIMGGIVLGEITDRLEDARSHIVPPVNFEYEITRPDSKKVKLSLTVLPLRSAAGSVTGAIVAFQDTTQLSAMIESLKRADRLTAMGRVAAGLAHEVRNPMGAMSSALQYLTGKENVDKESADLMGVVLRESERLNSIITNFLEYASSDSYNGSLGPAAEIDAAGAIKDCLALLRHDPAVSDKHEIDLQVPPDPVMIRTDETRFKQVVWNLARNSITAMPSGGKLSIDVSARTPDHVRVVFSDTGCGIPEGELERIFEPFHSGSNGSGLGLSIVHRIVTESGGRIQVKSRPDAGTSFLIDLPTNLSLCEKY